MFDHLTTQIGEIPTGANLIQKFTKSNVPFLVKTTAEVILTIPKHFITGTYDVLKSYNNETNYYTTRKDHIA